jgi:hypothetical protein
MRKEPEIRAELYRIITNIAERVIFFGNFKISNVAVEYPVNEKKADLVVFGRLITQPPDNPFLVIETKGRVFIQRGP